jgi:3-phosphoshikimate 1-carboxyvinyltransferase
LVEALRSMGASIEYLEGEGYPPLRIRGEQLKGGRVELRADGSSQYSSALALIAPFLEEGLELALLGEAVSMPYFRMTLSILSDLGVRVEESGRTVRVHPHSLPERTMWVEADHSAAAFWYELLAVSGKGALFLEGLVQNSPQGDRELPSFFRELGVQERWEGGGCWIEAVPGSLDSSPYEADLRHHPDLFPALLVPCTALRKPALFRGVGNLRFKESDRLEALRSELAKLGVELLIGENEAGLDPSGFSEEVEADFDPHGDHRIAMALAPLATLLPSMRIRDKDVVDKSHPGFWESFEKALPPASGRSR